MDIYRCNNIDGNGKPGWGLLNSAAPIVQGYNPLIITDETSGSGPQVTKWKQLFRIEAELTVDRDGWETAIAAVDATTKGLRR